MASTLATGIEAFDRTLDGLPAGSLVHVYGPPAAGKTTLTLALARELTPAALVLPERPHARRIADVLGAAADRTLIARPEGFEAQARAVERACELLERGRVRYVGLDSLTFLYRFERLSATDALQALFDQLGRLRSAARDGEAIAAFTNQVRGGPDGWQAIGGPAIAHASDVIVSLEVLQGPRRRLRVEKHPYKPAGRAVDAEIIDEGFA